MREQGIIGVYLAAGESRRMGRSKLSLPFGNKPLGSIALTAALQSALDHTLVIVKAGDTLEWLPPAFFEPSIRETWDAVVCEESRLGMSYSLKSGVQAAEARNAEAIVVLLADQPFVSAQMINDLIVDWKAGANPGESRVPPPHYGAYRFQGNLCPPVLFPRRSFPALMDLKGDEGARKLIRNPSWEGIVLEGNDPDSFLDLDTLEEAQALFSRSMIRRR